MRQQEFQLDFCFVVAVLFCCFVAVLLLLFCHKKEAVENNLYIKSCTTY